MPTPGGLHLWGGDLTNPGGSASWGGSDQPRGSASRGNFPNPGGSTSGGLHPGGSASGRVCRNPHPSPPTPICLQGGIGQPPLPPVNRMTHRCKNITLPQTSFAPGNERIWTEVLPPPPKSTTGPQRKTIPVCCIATYRIFYT